PTDPDAWLQAQQLLWTHTVAEEVPLGDALRAHPLVERLLAIASAAPRTLRQIDDELARQVPAWAERPADQRDRLLDSLLALLSHARRAVGPSTAPLVTVQAQLWSRELTRLLRALPDPLGAGDQPPAFAWHTDLPGNLLRPNQIHAPQAHCRECGIVGFAAVQTVQDVQRGRLGFAAPAVGEAWLHAHRDARFVWPRPVDPKLREGQLVWWLNPVDGSLSSAAFTDDDGHAYGCPVVLEDTMRTGQSQVPRFAGRCPACGNDDALRIVGARAASLTSVVVTHLFQSPYNTDKKLLAFTDSVQDAAHRAGFFGGRTFRIHLRTALQAVIVARQPLVLAEAAQAFEDHWRPRVGELPYVASFLPPDLRELPEYEAWVERKGKGTHDRLFDILRARLGWEFTRELGLAAGIGRSLERSAAATAALDPERFDRAADAFGSWWREQGEADPRGEPSHFLVGLVHRMRHMGAVHHPFLDAYAKDDGNRFLLNKQKNPHMTPEGPQSKRIRFVSSSGRGDVFPSPFGPRAHLGWFGDWMRRCLRWPSPSPDALGRVYRRALDALTEAGVLKALRHPSGGDLWGIDPTAVLLTADVGTVRSGAHGRIDHLPRAAADQADGKPSWSYRSDDLLHRVPTTPGYYARVYNRGILSRVFAGEHTGLLDRDTRTTLERRFLAGSTATDPQAPNLLVATPTLEMGVDIGDLSAALLCSVPPSAANYLQRVGRAGRKTGNALVFVMANTSPHDLYFHAEPTEMLAGVITPPGVFLGAVAMLQRQLTAWCLDRWAQHDDGAGPVPRKASLVLSDAGREQFLGRILRYLTTHRESLLATFLDRFADRIGEESRDQLSAWVRSDQHLATHLVGAFDAVGDQIKGYQDERDKALKRIKALEEDPTKVGNAPQEIADLKRYRMMLTSLIEDLRNKYPLNVLADASLLPNYAFPEAGVHLHSMLGGKDDKDDDGKRKYEKREYVRPASNALRELAPFNTFYAEGHKVQIRQLELGPKAARVQHWRFCPTCHHTERAVDPARVPAGGACPRCGDPSWVDKGQIRSLLPLTVVRSVADRLRSATVDDTEERTRESYHVHQVFELRPEDLDGEAVLLPQLGFGFEYLKRVTMTELNLGLRAALGNAPKVEIAGEAASAEGFATCRDCGGVVDPRGNPATPSATQRDQHTPFCPQRAGDTKPRIPLYLFREVASEGIRFLLPFSQVQVERQLRSFQAAIDFGLRRRFRGRPIHLQVTTMTEPEPTNRQVRKHFLVLFDTVPGGTGYLRDFRRRREVFALLQDTLVGLRDCPCRARGRDGCYLCLFAHRSQRWLPLLSSQLAERMLDDVLRARDTAQAMPGGLSSTSANTVVESELEQRFLDVLGHRYGDRFQERSDWWELRAGPSVWRLDQQVDLTVEAGEPMRADFVFTGIQGPALDERVVVECDGFAYHALPTKPRGRLVDDARKRVAVASRLGHRVFSLTWHDLDDQVAPTTAPSALASVSAAVWSKVYDRAAAKVPVDFRPLLARLHELAPLDLLCGYLEHPGAHWRDGVAALACAGLAGAAQAGQLLDGHALLSATDHLRSATALSPMPLLGLRGGPRPTEVWGRVALDGDCAALVTARGTDIVQLDPAGVQVVLRLADEQERRSAPDYVDTWRRFLQGLNLGLLLPEIEVFTTEGLGDALSEEGGLEVLDALGLFAAAPAPPGYGSPELEQVLSRCLDDEVRALVRAVSGSGTLPDLDPVELPGGAPAELTWSAVKVAVGRRSDLEPDDLTRAAEGGWTVVLLPVDPNELVRALAAPRSR
ncbi:MAG: helicase-related protein, partial [Myxococcota bacterium]